MAVPRRGCGALLVGPRLADFEPSFTFTHVGWSSSSPIHHCSNLIPSSRNATSDMTSQSAQFPLIKLAPDLQYAIFESLCGHCGSQDDAMAVLYHDPAEQTQTLSNLCLTSRHTRSIAESILYHFPRIYSYTDFFRTIHARPELAKHVKVMTWVYKEDRERFMFPKCLNPRKDITSREDVWHLRALAMELKLQNTGEREFAQTFAKYPRTAEDAPVVEDPQHELYSAFENLVTSIMLGLCPRLEFLSLNVPGDQERQCIPSLPKKPTRFLYLPGLLQQLPRGFPFLRTLVIQNTEHDDPHVLGIGSISFLWKSLPNLQRLIFFRSFTEWRPGFFSPITDDQMEGARESLRCLKELRFVRCGRMDKPLPLPAVRELVFKCTELERFVFSLWDVEGGAFSPLQLIHAISTTASTLRQLIISCPILEASAVDATQLVSDLRQFERLQSLIIDQPIFCRHHHFPDSDISPECLTGMLPASIRSLTINMHYPCAPLEDLVALGVAVSNGAFPDLQYLRVQIVFAEPTKCDPHDIQSLPCGEDHPALLALSAKLSDPEWSLSQYRQEIRQMLSRAFGATKVVLDLDYFGGCLYWPANGAHWPPHNGHITFSEYLVHEED